MRIVPLAEVPFAWGYLVQLARIFHHEIIAEGEIYFFKPNSLICAIRNNISLNDLWADFLEHKFTIEEMMKFYMDMGYSFSRFVEIFEKNINTLFGRDLNSPQYSVDNETLIEYIIEKYRGNNEIISNFSGVSRV